MIVQNVRNGNEALYRNSHYLYGYGIPMPSRAGDVLVAPQPVTTVYERPDECVMFARAEANPFFHMMEPIGFLAGEGKVSFYEQFVKRMASFSNDGVTLSGSYGVRWRRKIAKSQAGLIDQIEYAVELLRSQPFSRRAVITMLDPNEDLFVEEGESKDVPCNISVIFKVLYGARDEPNKLHMMTTARSHDLIWGATGANLSQFSFLQQYVAAKLGLAVGKWWQVSWNLHAYVDVFRKTFKGDLTLSEYEPDPYTTGEVTPYPMIQNAATWDRDLALFMEAPEAYGYDNPFFAQVAKPLWFSHLAYKRRKYDEALDIAAQCQASDWRKATTEWLLRRIAKHVRGK